MISEKKISPKGKLAPVAVFAYRRPAHLESVLTRLAEEPGIKQTKVHIFIDGPANPKEVSAVRDTIKVARKKRGFCQIVLHRSRKNRGLATAITTGVSWMCRRYGRVIVLEDDIQPRPGFLSFMNLALRRYFDKPQVFGVSAYNFSLGPSDTKVKILPLSSSWGWATWSRAWKLFRADENEMRKFLHCPIRRKDFDLQGAFPFSRLLQDSLSRPRQTWAVRWHYSMYCHQGVQIFPPVSLVTNIGKDGSGTHDEFLKNEKQTKPPVSLDQLRWPKNLQIDHVFLGKIRNYLRQQNKRQSRPKWSFLWLWLKRQKIWSWFKE